MPYTPEKPSIAPPLEELRARIPGWGVDLDPADRPSVPRERFDPSLSGAHWHYPEEQPEKWPRERSIEHEKLPPVFGTSCPPRGVSGALRKFAYAKYSEARAAHWLILLAADRVDVLESTVFDALRGRPDNPLTETGVLGEAGAHPVRSRVGQHRADLKHQWLDPLIVGAPWVLAGIGAYALGKGAVRVLRD
ncbi:MAG TPA: hypothetical protein VFQ39_17985 [Longimicrobium sp.]|nr:hypothetical protein [Longimicrobium sp.]